jgi:glycerol-3-phosphate O-acyltransferase
VPISINYERVLEAETYPTEMLGEEKLKESLIRVLNSFMLKKNFGRIHIKIGEFIDVK